MGSFHFGKSVKYRASEEHWITPKHYAHCAVHVARRIWAVVHTDPTYWFGDWSTPFTVESVAANEIPTVVDKVNKALYDNARAVGIANDVLHKYSSRQRMPGLDESIRLIRHRYRWVDAKPPGFFPAEVREAFYAILDAKETRAAYAYMRQFNVDHASRAALISALDELRR